jgi:glycosyltransferase involved in cell wall biosynthesis
MKIVFVIRWHSNQMGYMNNCLAESFARMGHEVHVITSKYQSYFNIPNYDEVYGKFLGAPIQPLGTEIYKGIHVHRVSSIRIKNRIILTGILSKLREIKPDVIQTFDGHEPSTVVVSLAKPFFKYKLFTGVHTILITFRQVVNWKKLTWKRKLFWSVFFYWPSKILVRNYETCYAVTRDASMIAHKMFGVPYHKIKVQTLGVDAHLYNNTINDSVLAKRESLGYTNEDIVCIYTGKITDEKKPLLLCKAIEELNKKGLRYKAIFIGAGKEDIIAEIKKYDNVQVLNFIPGAELPIHYKMADIAVWPNSITTSMLDAAACAKPVIVSDSVYAYDEVDGKQNTKPQIIASFFETGNHLDLTLKLEKFKDAQYRKNIGEKAMQYIMDNLSWDKLAEKRVEEYRKSI